LQWVHNGLDDMRIFRAKPS